MQEKPYPPQSAQQPYGWVIVAACALMIFVTYGLIYCYSVFFKPLAEAFQWDRSSTSMIYSLAVLIRAFVGIGTGWLADKYGARKIMIVCGLLMAVGYLLSSRISLLWQFFLTYAVIEAIGMSGTWGICTTLPSRWFDRNRGLALGVVTAGSGFGTLLIVPAVERLVNAFDWSQAFVICGIAAGALMVVPALFLKNPPNYAAAPGPAAEPHTGNPVAGALRDSRMWLIIAAFLFFFFGVQIVIIHIVNYATDVGIDPLVAATFVSVIGLVSIFSRLFTGAVAEKIGLYVNLIVTCVALAAVFILLIFTRSVWAFYVCAVIFGIPYGGETTLIPLVIGRFFGTRHMTTLMGISLFGINIGGASGAWMAGWIFDRTESYTWAFIAGAACAAISVVAVILLKKQEALKSAAAVPRM
jgi:MFS family permease